MNKPIRDGDFTLLNQQNWDLTMKTGDLANSVI